MPELVVGFPSEGEMLKTIVVQIVCNCNASFTFGLTKVLLEKIDVVHK